MTLCETWCSAREDLEEIGDRFTPLVRAVARRHLNKAKFLLELGSDIRDVFAGGQTLLDLAIYNNQGAMVKLLLENGADPHPLLQEPKEEGEFSFTLGRACEERDLGTIYGIIRYGSGLWPILFKSGGSR